LKSEPQNIEQEISNDEVWNRYALTILDKIKSREYLTSTFIIPCSIFVFYSFFPDQTGRFLARGSARVKLHLNILTQSRKDRKGKN